MKYRVYDQTGGGVTEDIEADSLAEAVELGREWIEGGSWESDDGTVRLGVNLAACVRPVVTRTPRPELAADEETWVSDIIRDGPMRVVRYDDMDREELAALAAYLEYDDGTVAEDVVEMSQSIAERIRDYLDEDDEDLTDDQPATDCSGSYSDPEPECDSDGSDDGEHDWREPHDLVGGVRENPGVFSLGGTRMAFRSVCACCGVYRREERAGSNRNPGEPKAVVTHEPADEASEAWVDSLRGE